MIIVKGVGTIEEYTCRLADGGDIQLTGDCVMNLMSQAAIFKVTAVFLSVYEDEWFMVVDQEVPEDFLGDFEESLVFEIENQKDIQSISDFFCSLHSSV